MPQSGNSVRFPFMRSFVTRSKIDQDQLLDFYHHGFSSVRIPILETMYGSQFLKSTLLDVENSYINQIKKCEQKGKTCYGLDNCSVLNFLDFVQANLLCIIGEELTDEKLYQCLLPLSRAFGYLITPSQLTTLYINDRFHQRLQINIARTLTFLEAMLRITNVEFNYENYRTVYQNINSDKWLVVTTLHNLIQTVTRIQEISCYPTEQGFQLTDTFWLHTEKDTDSSTETVTEFRDVIPPMNNPKDFELIDKSFVVPNNDLMKTGLPNTLETSCSYFISCCGRLQNPQIFQNIKTVLMTFLRESTGTLICSAVTTTNLKYMLATVTTFVNLLTAIRKTQYPHLTTPAVYISISSIIIHITSILCSINPGEILTTGIKSQVEQEILDLYGVCLDYENLNTEYNWRIDDIKDFAENMLKLINLDKQISIVPKQSTTFTKFNQNRQQENKKRKMVDDDNYSYICPRIIRTDPLFFPKTKKPRVKSYRQKYIR